MLILASGSPRRRELLKMLVPEFLVEISQIDEDKITAPADELAAILSSLKAKDVYSRHPDDTILACDTVVILNNEVLGKPKDGADAFKILKQLSNKTHEVITAFTIINKSTIVTKKVKTKVTFFALSDETIFKYIATKSPFDKAGGYGIQDKDFPLVSRIEGSYYNVMGLPLEELKKYL